MRKVVAGKTGTVADWNGKIEVEVVVADESGGVGDGAIADCGSGDCGVHRRRVSAQRRSCRRGS